MYLSKLELHGFKSFAERTVLHFDPGITAIVGPNGCGKSNIVDAVRWVIGEQRARILRSEKMENVIFNGTAKRKPLGLGEVLLTIENNRGVLPTEYSDVELGRRLYRSGDSEYLMNGVQCRLKDITDLFMDTGMGAGAYSVIELKMIEEILSENADDRRRLFEEAAGITRYKLRRRQTLSKLDNTQADLTRIRDLTDEISKQVRSLKRQASKAEKYKEHSARLHLLELALAHLEYTRLIEQRDRLKFEIASLKQESDKTGSSENREEASLERLRSDLQARESELTQRQADLNKHLQEVRTLETERKLAEERLESARRELDRARTEQEDAAGRRSELEKEIHTLTAAIGDADPALADAVEELEKVRRERDARRSEAEESRKTLQQLRQKERDLDNTRADQRRQLDRLLNRRELVEEDLERTQQQIRSAETALEDLRQRVTEADEHRARLDADLAAARAAFDEAAQQRSALEQDVAETGDAVRSLERRREGLAAEVQLLQSLLTSYDEFSGAVQYLASSEWADQDLETVADVLACDEEDRIALDAALGSFATCVVVDSDEEARHAVEMLRQHEQGRATFIVLDRLRQLTAVHRDTIDAAPLLDRVRTAGPEYRKLAGVLLRDCFVVDTLEDAARVAADAPDSARIFARTGEWFEARGIAHGGSRQSGPSPAASRLGRREQLQSTREELESIDERLGEAQQLFEEKRSALADVPFEKRREDVSAAERGLNEAEQAAARAAFELRSSDSRRGELSRRCDEAGETLAGIAAQIDGIETGLRDASAALETVKSQLTEAEAANERADAESRQAAARYNDANIQTLELRNRAENLHRDLDRTRRQLDELQARFEERKARIAELDGIISATDQKLDDAQTAYQAIAGRRQELDEAVAYADEAVRQIRDAIQNIEGGLRNIRRQREHLMKEEHQRDVRIAEVQTRASDLVEHIQDEFSIFLPDAVAEGTIEIPDDLNEKEARAEVGELRRSIRSLGAVNELALEDYEEEKERLDFLLQQQNDLESAEEKLLETITEINATASERFMETFEEIRANFQRIFNNLFGADAGADLTLADADDPLESAIEISARPRGKRPTGISQLSGGEKTLTAIALLFGIYLVKPSPFCILDEVDAPLDDANVERFMRLIREFSRDTQFILVTHNKRTMEAADRLYGITMQETGVSRLVGVKFDEAARIVDRASREAA